eukprot:SAG11_NODE_1937_length_4032_cov_6.541826_1_plen_321_part_00
MLCPYSLSSGIPSDVEIEGYVHSIRTQGFCCIEGVIPAEQLQAVRLSVIAGREQLAAEGVGWVKEGWTKEPGPDGIVPIAPPMLNEIACNLRLAQHIAEPRLLAVARKVLDPHLRISQTETRKDRPAGVEHRRSWHTDVSGQRAADTGSLYQDASEHCVWPSVMLLRELQWPHDLSSYGPTDEEPWRHCGAVSQPFPDVCMALSTVWYLGPDDVGPHNGATWIVPVCSTARLFLRRLRPPARPPARLPSLLFSLSPSSTPFLLCPPNMISAPIDSMLARAHIKTHATRVGRTTASTSARRFRARCRLSAQQVKTLWRILT